MNRLYFQIIDHDRIVLEGKATINEYISSGNLDVLRDYLSGLAFYPDQSIVEYRTGRLKKLISLNLPGDIVEHEKKSLAMVTGEAYLRSILDKDDFVQLRYKLINLFIPWCSFERYFEDHDFENYSEIFSSRDNIPKDDSGCSLISVQMPIEDAIEGYLSPYEIMAIPASVLILFDTLIDNESEDDVRFSQFIDRVIKGGFGLYYQLNIGVNS